MSKKKENNIAVYYHGNCPDGFGGAYAAWKKLGNKADYIPLTWDNSDHFETKADLIYFIDFSPEKLIRKFKEEGKRIIIIDHHVTAENLLNMADESLFRIENSGAVLAWRYFHPKIKTPKLLSFVEDLDIWKFALKGTKEISKVLYSIPFYFKEWDKIAKTLETSSGQKKIIEAGKYILQYEDARVNVVIAEGIRSARLDGKKAYVVNSPMNESVIGNLLSKDGAIGIIWSQRRDGRIKVSLRSTGNLDVSKIAKKHSGGGHKNAAGFMLESMEKAPWIYIKK